MQRKAYGSLTKIFMCLARKQTKPKHGGICLRPHGNRPLLPSRAICRFQSVSRGFCTRGGSGATVSPFRRNGITVPAQRHHRSGATASPFRRNGVTVPVSTRLINSAGRQRLPQRSATRFARTPLPKVGTAVPCGPLRLYPLVGAAVPCRPPRLYPLVGAAVPCRPRATQTAKRSI